jgi:hypothetical protein
MQVTISRRLTKVVEVVTVLMICLVKCSVVAVAMDMAATALVSSEHSKLIQCVYFIL